MNISLAGKNAFIMGSSKGIGKAVAVMLAQMGANVTLVARTETALMQTLIDLSFISNAEQAHDYLVADVSNTDKLKTAIEKHLLKTNKSYHILVNNAGGPPSGKITEAQNDEFISAFTNHLIANHTITNLLLPGMKKNNYGRIVNIISTSVKVPLSNLGVSNTVRAAVANWSKTLATEVGEFGITVNNVLPGATNTERLTQIIQAKAQKLNIDPAIVAEEMKNEIPLKRFANPDEIAAAVAFLASPSAAYITGINVPVDGGRTPCL